MLASCEGEGVTNPNNPFQSFAWVFNKQQMEDTPSIRAGMAINKEVDLRRDTCGYIQQLGMKLKMPQYTIATAITYFQRFFMRHRFQEYDRHLVGSACLFLAGKAEETPRKLKDTVAVSYRLKHPDKPSLVPDSQETLKRHEKLVGIEREVLKAILFNMRVEHPYQDLIKTVKAMTGPRELAQTAWNLINDSLRTTVALRFPPKSIAVSAIYLASKMAKIPINTNQLLDLVDVDIMEEVGNDILDLYEYDKRPSNGSKPVPNKPKPAAPAPSKAPAAPSKAPAAPPPRPPSKAPAAPPPRPAAPPAAPPAKPAAPVAPVAPAAPAAPRAPPPPPPDSSAASKRPLDS